MLGALAVATSPPAGLGVTWLAVAASTEEARADTGWLGPGLAAGRNRRGDGGDVGGRRGAAHEGDGIGRIRSTSCCVRASETAPSLSVTVKLAVGATFGASAFDRTERLNQRVVRTGPGRSSAG